MASHKGHTSTVEVLLRNGADPNLATTVSMEVVYLSLQRHAGRSETKSLEFKEV